MHHSDLFQSVFLGGFECSTHRRPDGRRLDLLEATQHDRWAASDYALLHTHGMGAVRDGVRWHLVETSACRYDWSSLLPMLRAAHGEGTQVIWDLCHYGWPDDIDIWRPVFVERFARYAAAVARLVRDETEAVPFYCPINEISYLSWAGGDKAMLNPLTHARGWELKNQLIRATIAAIEAIREVDPRARFITAEPLIHVTAHPDRPGDRGEAEAYRRAQYQTCDMLIGELWPGLGGKPEYLDIVGVNYYERNQWFLNGESIPSDSLHYRPLHDLLGEVSLRFDRPILIAETGAEADFRAPWLDAVCAGVDKALAAGVPVEGICLYPVLDYPGWEDERHCATGLFGTADSEGGAPSTLR